MSGSDQTRNKAKKGTLTLFRSESNNLLRHRQDGNKTSDGNVYSDPGHAYQKLLQLDKAKEFHRKCLNIALKINDTSDTQYNGLGNVWSIFGLGKAMDFYLKYLGVTPTKADEGIAYSEIGGLYCSSGHFDKAIEFHEKSPR